MEYAIVTMIKEDGTEEVQVHKHIGGGAYYMEFSGNHNEVAEWLNSKGVKHYTIGH